MSAEPRYAFDIETTGLDWRSASVTTYAIYGPGVAIVDEDADERRLIMRMKEAFSSLPRGVVLTWNGAIFDGPFLAARSRALGMEGWFSLAGDASIAPKYEPQPGFEPIGLHPIFPALGGARHDHRDVAYGYWRSWAEERGCHWSLKSVAKAVGFEPIEVDRERMDGLSVAERLAYCLSDVTVTYELDSLKDKACVS